MSIIKRSYHGHPEPEHEHKLELKSYNKQFTCDGCKEQGFGSRYKCEHCGYELHKECKFPTPTISHDFFQGSVFEFHQLCMSMKCPDRHCKCHIRCCDACGNDINGFVYHCRTKGWDLHPCCSKLEKEISIDGTDFLLRDQVISKCMWCKKKKLWGAKSRVPGWSYVSQCEKYHFHVYCVTEMVHEAWKKGRVDDSDNSKALAKMDLRVMANSRKRGGKSSEFWRIVRMFLNTIVSILLGDPFPTIPLAYNLVELLLK